jgi:pimeloyl-ACP methyl ester carboxylesterase
MMMNSVLEKLEILFPLLDWETIAVVVQRGCFIWIILEILFWLVITFFVSPRLQVRSKPHDVPGCPLQFFFRILDTIDLLGNSYPIEQYISGFCRNAPIESIQLGNFSNFLCWAMFDRDVQDLTVAEQRELEAMVTETQRRYPVVRTMKPGINPDVQHCCFTLEPVPHLHRPLLLYILAGFNECVWNSLILRTSGFRSMRLGIVHYWIKHGNSSNSADSPQPPLLFFHGITPGWSLYLLLLWFFGQNRTVILVDFDPIKIKSMNFYSPSVDSYCEHVKRILQRHGIARASVLGHSFGSITAGWFVRRFPSMVCHLTLVDPVSLLLAFPEVAYSFLYRQPRTIVEWVIDWTAAREITVSYALRRNFNWKENTLHLDDIPSDIGVVIGVAMSDEITCPATVAEYGRICHVKRYAEAALEKPVADITVKQWPGFSHGQILLSWKTLQVFKDIVAESERKHIQKL